MSRFISHHARRFTHLIVPLHPLALATLLALAGTAQAQSTSEEARQLPAVTVTATLSEHDARTAPASVTVITRANPF